jgi:hypothetical protein
MFTSFNTQVTNGRVLSLEGFITLLGFPLMAANRHLHYKVLYTLANFPTWTSQQLQLHDLNQVKQFKSCYAVYTTRNCL